MPVHSAALLAYRVSDDALVVFVGHLGGPFWAGKDDGGWSIPKGEFDPSQEAPEAAARREFAEEIGVVAPAGPALDLGVHVQRGGKRVHAFAVAASADLAFVASNTFVMSWPRGSDRLQEFPEIDRAQWFSLEVAARKLVAGQVPILAALESAVRGTVGT